MDENRIGRSGRLKKWEWEACIGKIHRAININKRVVSFAWLWSAKQKKAHMHTTLTSLVQSQSLVLKLHYRMLRELAAYARKETSPLSAWRNWSCLTSDCCSEAWAIDGVSWISQFGMWLLSFVSIQSPPWSYFKSLVIVIKAVARPHIDVPGACSCRSEGAEHRISYWLDEGVAAVATRVREGMSIGERTTQTKLTLSVELVVLLECSHSLVGLQL